MSEKTGSLTRQALFWFDKWVPRLLNLALSACFVLGVGQVLAMRRSEEDVSLGCKALFTLWGAHTWIQLILVLCVGVVVLAGFLIGKKVVGNGRARPLVFAILTFLAVSFPLYLVGTSLAAGEWVSQQSWAFWARLAPPAVVGTLLGVLAWLCAAFPATGANRDPKTWRRLGLTGLLYLCSVAASYADNVVFPGLYPDFHLMSYMLASLFACVATARLLNSVLDRLGSLQSRCIGVFSIIITAFAIVLFASSDMSTRAELVQNSAVADTVFSNVDVPREKSSYFYKELEALDPNAGAFDEAPSLPRGRLPKVAPNGKPWNIALIIVDALRADALQPVRTKNREHARLEDTPFIDAWGKNAFRFNRAYSQTSTTHRSMPPMFRSIHPHEMYDNIGLPLADYMRKLGRVPVAVVNNYFVEPRVDITNELKDGFELVSFYNIVEHEKIFDRTEETLATVGDQPFFMWMHIYNMHSPGYAGHLLSKEDGSFKARYRKALRWLDGCYEKIMKIFERSGVAENTIVILGADHGESVGENGHNGHGMTVFEEEIRVPLQIMIPGQEGRIIDGIVGNVDLLPTITEMVGGPLNPDHRGRSLVPLLMGDKVDWTRPYYFENGRGRPKLNILSVIDGSDKLIYKRHQDLFFRYDLSKDPTEDDNLYADDGVVDTHLRRQMLRFNPIPFADELRDARVSALLIDRLKEVSRKPPGSALPWLLQLAALEGGKESMDVAEKIFETADSDRVKVQVLRYCYSSDPSRFGKLIVNHLKRIEGKTEELAFVGLLQGQGQKEFDPRYVGRRLSWWAKNGEPEDWIPWLKMTGTWKAHAVGSFGPAFEEMLGRMQSFEADSNQVDVAWLLLDNIRLLNKRGASRDDLQRLARLVEPFFDHPRVDIQNAAGFALSVVGDKKSLPLINRKLDSDKHLVKQAALNALARVGGSDATLTVSEIGAKNSLLSMDAVWLLKDMGDKRAIPYLENIEKNHDDQFVRRYAKEAIATIEKRCK